ncbi:MAG: PSD1 and planctomycete cytochrome C domain-containing protein [Planctomycetota bacterium]
MPEPILRPLFVVVTLMIAWVAQNPVAFQVQVATASDLESRAGSSTDESQIGYSRHIRPLLSKHCFACHGPDEDHRESDVRLDVPGEIDLDAVIERIRSDDPAWVMPPPSSGKPLREADKRRLERWIDAGAEYETHWSFQTPQAGVVDSGKHPVDHFVDRKLHDTGLARSPVADPQTLVRRLYLDLVGTVPPIEIADAFSANPSEIQYRRLVDRLLASPDYATKWARPWLDLARYADTNGYEKDRDRTIWPYRDWVIRAIGSDMPFDQFTIQQLAGDMLPGATLANRIATGFHRNTMLNEEGGIDPLEFRYHAMADRVATTGTTWLGLTLGCAQCHTHKYDPITHDDYFGIMAMLNNADEPEIPIDGSESATEIWRRGLDQLLAKVSREDAEFQTKLDDWVEIARVQRQAWRTLRPQSLVSEGPYLVHGDGDIIRAGGDITKHDVYSITLNSGSEAIRGLRLEALADPDLPAGGPGLAYYEGPKGTFFLSEFSVRDAAGQKIPIAGARVSYAKNGFGKGAAGAAEAIDGDIQSGWSIADGSGQDHVAVFELETPIPAGSRFEIEMHFGRHFAASLGKFRISAAAADGPLDALQLSELEWQSVCGDDARQRPAVQKAFLRHHDDYREPVAKIRRQIAHLRRTTTLTLRERPAEFPRQTYLRHRGEYTLPKHVVPPRLPEALGNVTDTRPQDRLEFARWLVTDKHPLTARVVVNRHWAAFFGTGLVPTVEDFGMQGEYPTHPRLLDHLAVGLVDHDWSIKWLHRMIVTSQTYRQRSDWQSVATGDSLRDYAVFPRTRLDAETLRDVSLDAAGMLQRIHFGPPVRPTAPRDDVAANYSKSKWVASQGGDRFRPSIYTYRKRTAPFAMFMTFDGASGEVCVARRDRSNTPLQALTLLNDPMFMEIAAGLGKRMQSHAETTNIDAAISLGFRSLLTRHPGNDESAMLRAFQEKHSDWSATARVLLCLDESICKN